MSLVYWITTEQEQRLAIVERPRGNGWLEDDIKSLYEAGIEVLVSALMPGEERELGLTEEAACCSTYNIEFIWLQLGRHGLPFRCGLDDLPIVFLSHPHRHLERRLIRLPSIRHFAEPQDAFFLIGSARRCPVPDTDEQNEWIYKHVNQLRDLANEADNG